MCVKVTERGLKRRELMSSALAWSGMAAAARVVGPSQVWGAVSHKPLDPVNPDSHHPAMSRACGCRECRRHQHQF